ncbi:RNA polymerase sigma factor [Nonlabens xiamenensis]|uniref:RNA polymerase sigma factor n=1 Tax=Nonlabens xiamenensis TaxID=2341043 RepID=UPI000F610155|nr:RNA polymerase sigma factor [Nonlabens xiamenensis]
MDKQADSELVNLILDPATRDQGFRLLLTNYKEQLYWQIRKIVLQHDDADDVLQNVFVKIYKGIKNFKGDSKLSTWMYRIAYNESMTHLTKKARHLQISSQELQDHMVNQLEADVYFTSDQVNLELQKALSQLPDRQREVFNMRYFDDLMFKEVADVLGLTEGAVKSTYHIAAKKVEKFIRQDETFTN